MKRLNLREIEVLNSLYLRFIEDQFLEDLGVLQFRAALAKERNILEKELARSNPDYILIFKRHMD